MFGASASEVVEEVRVMEKIISGDSKGLPRLITFGTSDTNLDYIIMLRYGDSLKSLMEEMESFSCKTVI